MPPKNAASGGQKKSAQVVPALPVMDMAYIIAATRRMRAPVTIRDSTPTEAAAWGGAAPSPDWRALVYGDAYKADDDAKAQAAAKYEPLLEAQRRLQAGRGKKTGTSPKRSPRQAGSWGPKPPPPRGQQK